MKNLYGQPAECSIPRDVGPHFFPRNEFIPRSVFCRRRARNRGSAPPPRPRIDSLQERQDGRTGAANSNSNRVMFLFAPTNWYTHGERCASVCLFFVGFGLY